MLSPSEGWNFWVGPGDGCEIRLDDRDIEKKYTGIRVDGEGIVWITDMGGRGGTRMIGDKLTPHSERRLSGNEFWCGRKGRHFRVSRSIPSPGDFLVGDSSGGKEDGRGVEGPAERHGGRPEEPAEKKRDTTGPGEEGTRAASEGVESGSMVPWSGARLMTLS